MAKKDSSSKTKSSKRKTSKIISKTKKKSRRNRLKKARHAEHSVSTYSDDESKSLLSGSESNYSSSSEDDRKNRKGRSQARGEAKSRKKRARKRSSSPESSQKKRKRSKKDVKLRLKKKSRKGRRKRDLSLSSASESQSCSSCQGSSSNSSEEREPRRKRGRSRESKKHKRDRSKVKIKSQISRSKSPSSYSRDGHHIHNVSHDKEEITMKHVSRRLRSVITVVKRQEEEDISTKDPYKEEMFDNRYDYPSSRSNDSYDGVNKNGSDIALDNTETEGNETNKKEVFAEYDITDGATHAGDPGPFLSSQEAEIKHGGMSSEVYEQTEDLELLLRQKALENLRKFLVEKQKKLTTTIGLEGQSETRVIQSSAAKTSNVHEKPMQLDCSIEQDPTTYVKTKNSCSTPSETNTGYSVSVECERSHGENTREGPVMSIPNGSNQTSKISEKEKKNIVALDVNVKLGSATPAHRQKTVPSSPALKPRTSPQYPVSNSGTLPARSHPLTPSLKNNQATRVVLGVSSSTDNELKVYESTSAEKIATEQQDQSKDGSQYEKKTMSVMRGGEMVQVNYKVYIPKKTPALHRRHLNG